MHGLAPAAGTDVLASGPHQHPEAQLALAGLGHGLAAASADPAFVDGGISDQAMPASSGITLSGASSSGAPAPGHGGHGSRLEGLCLAVLVGGIAVLCLVVLGRRGPGTAAQALLRRLRAALEKPDPYWEESCSISPSRENACVPR